MNTETNLQKLQYYINEAVISKENVIASLKKEYSRQSLETRNHHLTILEQEVAEEEDLSSRILKTTEHLHRLNLKRDLEYQIELKKAKQEEEKAEGVIESLTAKARDREYFQELEKIRHEKVTDKIVDEFMKHDEEYKKLKTIREKEKDSVIEARDERHRLLIELQREYENQQKERKKLQKIYIEADLGLSLQKNFLRREELKNLREEDQVLKKEKEEEEEIIRIKEKNKRQEQNILQERQQQLRLKEESKIHETERAKEYVRLLTELLAEEEGLHRLRSEVANRKKREHHVVAQKILEERRRRRSELIFEKRRRLQEDQELAALRDSLLEEEEKRLLLQYLPHLGPFLSSYVVEKLAQL